MSSGPHLVIKTAAGETLLNVPVRDLAETVLGKRALPRAFTVTLVEDGMSHGYIQVGED